MFSKKKNSSSSQKVETVIGKDTSFQGELVTEGSIRIEGRVRGQVDVNGNVFVGRDGRVEADISANSIIIAGSVQADVVCRGKLEILPQGKLVGDIQIAQIIIQDGGTFIGQSKKYEPEEGDKKTKASVEDKIETTSSKDDQQQKNQESTRGRSQRKGKKS